MQDEKSTAKREKKKESMERNKWRKKSNKNETKSVELHKTSKMYPTDWWESEQSSTILFIFFLWSTIYGYSLTFIKRYLCIDDQ